MIKRKITRQVKAGSLLIGGEAPVSIQSMTNIPIEDVEANIRQINGLADAGAELVRLAMRNEEASVSLEKILKGVSIPICADIHFNYRIALAAIKAGVHKVRINPGNIGDESKVREVVAAAKDRGVPIRIGVNGGSVDRDRYGSVTPESLVASAMDHVRILEDNNFTDIVVSIKSSDLFQTLEATRLFSETRDYPIHIGLTEAGYGLSCVVQSSIAIGHLLLNGIGDTIRVSMTGDPLNEVAAGKKILEALGERFAPIKIVSCPTCGRTDTCIDVLGLAERIDAEANAKFGKKLTEQRRTIHIAVMGCEVNGPGEARDSDVGIAGGRNGAMMLFAKGEKVRKIQESEAVQSLMNEIEKMV